MTETRTIAGRPALGVLLLLVAVVILLLAAFGAHPGLTWSRFQALGLAAGFCGLLVQAIGL